MSPNLSGSCSELCLQMRKDVTKWDLCTLHCRGQRDGKPPFQKLLSHSHNLDLSLIFTVIQMSVVCIILNIPCYIIYVISNTVFLYISHMQQKLKAVLNKAQPAYLWDSSTAKNFCVCHERASPENAWNGSGLARLIFKTCPFPKVRMFVCFRLGFNGSASWRSSSLAPGVEKSYEHVVQIRFGFNLKSMNTRQKCDLSSSRNRVLWSVQVGLYILV